MKLGSKLRELRLKKSVTQEQMAGCLQVTTQCISKWENNVTMPDIEMLPGISAYFGVTIDELFDLTDDVHVERIENMMRRSRVMEMSDFCEAEDFLRRKNESEPDEPRYHALISELYNHMADGYRYRAESYAKRAVALAPEEKYNHSLLRMAQQGTMQDWNFTNHAERIDYYKVFVKEHPSYDRGYICLIDELIEDGRLREAENAAESMEHNCPGQRSAFYRGLVKYRKGENGEAWSIWNTMLEKYGEEWLAYASLGDAMAKSCRYEKAIEYYERALALQEKPRYTDSQEAIAMLYEIMGDRERAAEAWEKVISILRDEHGVKEGTAIEAAAERINRLKKS